MKAFLKNSAFSSVQGICFTSKYFFGEIFTIEFMKRIALPSGYFSSSICSSTNRSLPLLYLYHFIVIGLAKTLNDVGFCDRASFFTFPSTH